MWLIIQLVHEDRLKLIRRVHAKFQEQLDFVIEVRWLIHTANRMSAGRVGRRSAAPVELGDPDVLAERYKLAPNIFTTR